MTRILRRGALCVPASEPAKIVKAAALEVDEIIIDLEDAVVPDLKDSARANLDALPLRNHGLISVRTNAIGSPWWEQDLLSCVCNNSVSSVVIPKVHTASDVRTIDDALTAMEAAVGREAPLDVQALIESAEGLANVGSIASGAPRLISLILGYADLSVSLGRRITASWDLARDLVLLAARANALQPIDGPYLGVEDDDDLRMGAATAADLGFDGKWMIHPRQIRTVQASFTPTDAEVTEAVEVLHALSDAASQGMGAVQWRGRMLDEALAQQARRVLSRVSPSAAHSSHAGHSHPE